jgi:hypothetical protein
MKNAIVGILGLLCLTAGLLIAQASPMLTVNATVNTRYKLELSSNAVTFTRVSNPQNAPTITQNEPPIQVTVKATTSWFMGSPQTINLRIQAVGNLVDAQTGITIPVAAITWEATGAGYVTGGNLVPNTAQLLGTWNASGNYQGTLRFSFQDNPNYAPGVYRLVVTLDVGSN